MTLSKEKTDEMMKLSQDVAQKLVDVAGHVDEAVKALQRASDAFGSLDMSLRLLRFAYKAEGATVEPVEAKQIEAKE